MDRGVFRFHDGSRNWLGMRRLKKADPLAVARALDRHARFCTDKHVPAILKYRDGRLPSDTKDRRAGMHDAIEISAEAVRDAFGVKPLAQGGLTDMQCVDLLLSFLGYLAALKKNTRPSLTPPQSTAAMSSESNGPTTNATSPSSFSESGSDGGESTNSDGATSPDGETSN